MSGSNIFEWPFEMFQFDTSWPALDDKAIREHSMRSRHHHAMKAIENKICVYVVVVF